MNTTTSSPAPVSAMPVDLRHRRHTLNPNRTFLDRCGIVVQTAMEWSVASVSPHGDPHIYNTRLFPWAREIEQEWQLIRDELDAVMTFRDKMPSFQDILKEVGAIQSDNNWKTFFLAGIGMDCGENRKRCPETVRLLGKIPGM
ncbi:MAG TPA: aspartyl/asparaginyl beta-hydroxylase domain-containing protein, partial [Candidatus Acidoferrum sp.]|nr:aspartyl/asparaginyl beta-hydroxylase domain-containing protein [Candidatus Acidoferrum sp.]